LLLALLHLLDISNRAISSKRDVSVNRRIAKLISVILFTEKNLHTFFLESDRDSIQRVYSLVKDVDDLDPAILIELKHIIMERFPDFTFFGEDKSNKVTISGGLLVTQKSYDTKQKQLKTILEVEIPKNSQEIGTARDLGDLKENAEYKAGKEKQELLSITVGRLKDELDRAVIISSESVNKSQVSFGTKVTMKNLKTKKQEVYTILGPWESNPEKNIISYLAPFGSQLLNHAVGEVLEFIINEREYAFKILKIETVPV
jgi:transcription elongation factor GreA